MCDFKKLCTCESVEPGEDYWVLEFQYGRCPGGPTPTRPEHQSFADKYANSLLSNIVGPTPSGMFEQMATGVADTKSFVKILEDEAKWLNSENPFDFDFEPFQGDRLTFFISRFEVEFRFYSGEWEYCSPLRMVAKIPGSGLVPSIKQKALNHLKESSEQDDN